MKTRILVLLGLAAIVILGTSPAVAQRVDVEKQAPTTEPRLEIVPPRLQGDVTRPSDHDFYPDGPRVQHDPAFIEPLTAETETGRMGLSGWTAPQTPVGAAVTGHRDVSGWLAVGFSATWGGPPKTKPRPVR